MILPDNLPIPDHRQNWRIVDSTKLQAFARCPRKYFYEYTLGWRLDAPSNHLIFGQAWHESLAHLYSNRLSPMEIDNSFELFLKCYRSEFPESTDEWFGGKTPEAAYQGLFEYLIAYASDAYKIKPIVIEAGGFVPIAIDRNLVVKMDLIAEDEKGIIFLEHKTGSQAGRTWEMQWDLSLQIGAYLHGLLASYCSPTDKVRGFVNGAFFYKAKRVFQRVTVTRSGSSMLGWLNTVNHLWSMMEYEYENLSHCSETDNTLRAFPIVPTACTDFGGCPYHTLCVSLSNPLKYANQLYPISGYKYFWWNPLEEVKESVQFRQV